MNILRIATLTLGLALTFSASAENQSAKTETKKTKATTRDAASGLPTGKRQHKPLSSGHDNDCDGLSAKACAKKKAQSKKKGYDYYKSKSDLKVKSTKQNGEDLILRKRPGRAADKDDKGKKDKKNPLKHEK
jgi:hypothetical protein